VPDDPAEYVEAPRQKQAKIASSDVWTQEQAQKFADQASKYRLHAAYLMSCYGFRRSEVCGLRWSDVDLKRGTLSVEQSFVEVEGKEHAVDEPKTDRSRRTLPLRADVATTLQALKTRKK
jgi:integrase